MEEPSRLRNLLFTYHYYVRMDYVDVVVLTTTSTDLPQGFNSIKIDDRYLKAPSKNFLLKIGIELLPTGTPLLFVDADMILKKMAVRRFFRSITKGMILKPCRITRYLSPEASNVLKDQNSADDRFWTLNEDLKWRGFYIQGGAWGFINTNGILNKIGFPIIYGWGVEDSLFTIIAYNLGYDIVHFDDESMLHLWHPLTSHCNSSGEHNALQALHYLHDLEKNNYKESTFSFTPGNISDVDNIDEGLFRCDMNSLFNLIGDCYFRVLGYSFCSRKKNVPLHNRPKLCIQSIEDILFRRGLLIREVLGENPVNCGDMSPENIFPKLDTIYSRYFPGRIPTSIDINIKDLFDKDPSVSI